MNDDSIRTSRFPKAPEKVAFEEVKQTLDGAHAVETREQGKAGITYPHKSHGGQSKRSVEYEREVVVLLLAEVILLRCFITGSCQTVDVLNGDGKPRVRKHPKS